VRSTLSLLDEGVLRFDPSTGLFYHKGLEMMEDDATYWPDLLERVRSAFKEEWRALPPVLTAVPV
jgi:hypothetical protein